MYAVNTHASVTVSSQNYTANSPFLEISFTLVLASAVQKHQTKYEVFIQVYIA